MKQVLARLSIVWQLSLDLVALAGKSAASSELKSAFCLINIFDISINYSGKTAALQHRCPMDTRLPRDFACISKAN